jgi:nitrate reductase NapA
MVGASLSDALDVVAERLEAAVEEYGRDSVALFGSAQWSMLDAYVGAKLFKGGLGSNNVETSTRLFASATVVGLETTFGLDGSLGGYEDVDHADVFVLWDTNLAESDPVLFSRMLQRKRANPSTRVLDLDTRMTRTGYAADRTILHRPHTTLLIANAICQELVARNWVDRAFVDQHVAFKSGVAELGDGLTDDGLVVEEPADVSWESYVAFLSDFTPERVEGKTGVPASTIRWLASLYADRSRTVMSVWGPRVNQDVAGVWTHNALYNVHLLVGRIGRPGNTALALSGQPNGGNVAREVGALADTLPRGSVTNAADREHAAEIWGVGGDRIDARPGRHALAMFRALERGDIRFLWIQDANPMASLPNTRRYRAAAARDDRFLVVSEAYPTATTDLADVVLPTAMWLESDGVFTNVERRMQQSQRMVGAPGAAVSNAWQMMEVARRLGFEGLFPSDEEGAFEILWDEYRRFHTDTPTAAAPTSALRSAPGVQWPFVGGRSVARRYDTGSDPFADEAQGSIEFYGHDDGRAWIWLRPEPTVPESPEEAYPFRLETGAVLEHSNTGTLTQRIPTLHLSVPHSYAELHPQDAEDLGIRHGETIRVVSRRGAVELEARIDYRSQPIRGQVFVPWFDEVVAINQLTSDAFCPLSGQPAYGATAVRLERVNSRGAP